MKKQWLVLTGMMLCCICAQISTAQIEVNEAGEAIQETTPNCSTTTTEPVKKPVDGICEKTINQTKHILQPSFVHERDVMWEKRIWREIHLSQLMNQHFANTQAPLIEIFLREAKCGNLTVYHPIDDQFSSVMQSSDLENIGGGYDTITIYDPETYTDSFLIVQNDFNPVDVISYRIKEVWYFDSHLSRMNVRILGIAPIAKRYDDRGNVAAIMPLFWVYYPDARDVLTRNNCSNPLNNADNLSWDDIFQARYFASTIVKESNIHDRRIVDYAEGVNALYEAERIHSEIFNYEQDLWSY